MFYFLGCILTFVRNVEIWHCSRYSLITHIDNWVYFLGDYTLVDCKDGTSPRLLTSLFNVGLRLTKVTDPGRHAAVRAKRQWLRRILTFKTTSARRTGMACYLTSWILRPKFACWSIVAGPLGWEMFASKQLSVQRVCWLWLVTARRCSRQGQSLPFRSKDAEQSFSGSFCKVFFWFTKDL